MSWLLDTNVIAEVRKGSRCEQGQEEDRQKSKEAGFDAHMVKPVDYYVLLKLLASLDTVRSGRSQATAG